MDQANLNRWFSEGRVGANYQIREGTAGAWRAAAEFQPQAAHGDVAPSGPRSPYGPATSGHAPGAYPGSNYPSSPYSAGSPSPYSSPASPSGYSQTGAGPVSMYQYEKADMSVLVICMGILSWVLIMACIGWIPGLVAWIMGRTAMQDIQAGKSDPNSFSLVQVGYYLGMVNVIVSAIVIFFGLAWIFINILFNI